jgi:hypothetical protein
MKDKIQDFLHTRLLFWLEVLSLIKEVNIASKVLLSIIEWTQVSFFVCYVLDAHLTNKTQDDNIAVFTADAYKFVAVFGSVISQSAPHIYLSALPSAPEGSKISQKYLPQFPQVLHIESGKQATWPAIQNIMEGHIVSGSSESGCGMWLSVAFSQDGKHIVSGSDRTI